MRKTPVSVQHVLLSAIVLVALLTLVYSGHSVGRTRSRARKRAQEAATLVVVMGGLEGEMWREKCRKAG